MKRNVSHLLLVLALPGLIVASLGFMFQSDRGLSRETPAEFVATYDSLADAILAVKTTETNLVRSILQSTMGHAHAALQRALRALEAGDAKAARTAVEDLAAFAAQLANEGDNAVAGVRKRLVEGGHHHHAAGEMKGIYDEGFVVVTREAKKAFLDASRAIAQMSGAPDAAALEAEWKKIQETWKTLASDK